MFLALNRMQAVHIETAFFRNSLFWIDGIKHRVEYTDWSARWVYVGKCYILWGERHGANADHFRMFELDGEFETIPKENFLKSQNRKHKKFICSTQNNWDWTLADRRIVSEKATFLTYDWYLSENPVMKKSYLSPFQWCRGKFSKIELTASHEDIPALLGILFAHFRLPSG